MRPQAFAALLLAATLPACSSLGGLGSAFSLGPEHTSSVSTTIEPGDAPVLAASIADLVARRVSSAAAPVRLDRASDDGLLGPEIAKALQGSGYRLSDSDGFRVSYRVGSLADGVLVRVNLNGVQAARLFARGRAGALTPRGPYSLREAGQ